MAYFIDKNVTFFESNYEYINIEKNFLTLKEKNNIVNKVNYIDKNGVYNGTIFIGLNSIFTINNILNSDFYKKDLSIDQSVSAFDDSQEYNGNKITVSINPNIFKSSYGQDNPDAIFEAIANEPFDDLDNIENINEFFLMPQEIKYPRYFNAYSLSRLNSNICVFGILESVDGTMTTEKSLKGIKVEYLKNGSDSRGRSITISDKISLNNLKKDSNGKLINEIETYSDEEYSDLVTGGDALLQRSFKYTNRVINGQVYTIFDTSENASSASAQLTNKIIFYTEDDNNIAPFDDTRMLEIENANYAEDDIYFSAGQDNNNANGGMPDSIAFSGEGN